MDAGPTPSNPPGEPDDHPSVIAVAATTAIDMVVMPEVRWVATRLGLVILILLATVVGLPILFATMLAVGGLTQILARFGLPDALQGLIVLVFGFGGGLALMFVVFVRIQRWLERLPGLAPRPAPLAVPAPPITADPVPLLERVSALDADLAADAVHDGDPEPPVA